MYPSCHTNRAGSRIILIVAENHRADRADGHFDVVKLTANRAEGVRHADVKGVGASGGDVVSVCRRCDRAGKDDIRGLSDVGGDTLCLEAAIPCGNGNDDIALKRLVAGDGCGGASVRLGSNGHILGNALSVGAVRPRDRPTILVCKKSNNFLLSRLMCSGS